MKLNLKQPKKIKVAENKIKVPDGFTMVIDTSETLPLFVKGQKDPTPRLPEYADIPIVFKPISTHKKDGWEGDYSIDGFETMFGIERKMSSDFFGYIGRERKKTISKLNRLSNMEYACLVLEELNVDDLEYQQGYTKLHPSHAFGFIKSIEMWNLKPNGKNGIHFLAHRSRKFIEKWVLDRMCYFYNIKKGL